ncbi:hypothetical protein F0562_017910 [Nyssa sinensis]|uniref:Uncharacterized protein n=1 Tax=Nyssa sinensis TaxID=561372 RepID=A0A5J4ZBV8_9ASTE|nr:hypothetical protein F0562_017910 [Nyssa sinensis]
MPKGFLVWLITSGVRAGGFELPAAIGAAVTRFDVVAVVNGNEEVSQVKELAAYAKEYEASGFCCVNDIVFAIFELLKVHDRVL